MTARKTWASNSRSVSVGARTAAGSSPMTPAPRPAAAMIITPSTEPSISIWNTTSSSSGGSRNSSGVPLVKTTIETMASRARDSRPSGRTGVCASWPLAR